MDFTQQTTSDGAVVSLAGAFTFKDHHSFRSLLDVLKIVPGRRLVLDLSRVEFLDSAALGMLLIAEDEAKIVGCTLILRKAPPSIARLIQLAAMDTLFTIEP
ncbi:MAG: STAS domain-containing protein [Rhodospirillales bacterium]